MNRHLLGSILIIASVILTAVQVVLVRFIKLNTLTMLSYFQVFFIISISIAHFWKNKNDLKPKHNMKLVFLSSLFIFSMMVLYYNSLRITTVANAGLMRNTAPIFAFVFAVLFLKERFEWQSIVSIFIAMAGVYFIFQASLGWGYGILLGLLSGAAWGGLITTNRALASKGNVISLMFYQTIFVTLYTVPFLFLEAPSFSDLILILIFTVFFAFIPTIMMLSGLKYVKAMHAGIFSYAEVFFIALFGWLIFNESIGANVIAGGILIIVSGIWILRREAISS